MIRARYMHYNLRYNAHKTIVSTVIVNMYVYEFCDLLGPNTKPVIYAMKAASHQCRHHGIIFCVSTQQRCMYVYYVKVLNSK